MLYCTILYCTILYYTLLDYSNCIIFKIGGKNDTYLLVHYGFIHEAETDSYVALEPPAPRGRGRRLKAKLVGITNLKSRLT